MVLDAYRVESSRYENAMQLAINQERSSVNIKNVISADAFGEIPSGNVGEFVKFMPGIQVDYGNYGGSNQGTSDSDASGISIRGFGPEDTEVLIDGMPVSNAHAGSLTRQVGLDMLQINNAARVEVLKVPTPDMPANSIGGQVNLITRTAFEYARPTYNWSVFLTGNLDSLDFDKTPGPTNKSTRKINPSGTLSVAYPVNDKFGFTVSASHIKEFDRSTRASPNWSVAQVSVPGTSTPEQAAALLQPSYAAPWLSRFQITETPALTEKNSANIKFDWKPWDGHLVWFNYQYSTYSSDEAQRRLSYQSTNNGATLAANQQPVAWGPDFVQGVRANNNPRVEMTVTTRDKVGDTNSGALNWSFRKGPWDIGAAASISVSNGEFRDVQNEHFSEAGAIIGASGTPANQIQVNYNDISRGIPGSIEVIGAGGSGAVIDTTQLSDWRVSELVAKSGEAFSEDTKSLYKFDVRRELDFLPGTEHYTLALKAGFRREEEEKKKWGRGTGYQERLNPGATFALGEVVDPGYVGQSPGFGLPAQQWVSTYTLFELDQERDLFSVIDESNAINNYNSFVNQQKAITETRDGYYAQLEGRFLNNRLSFVGGMRQETRAVEGLGPFTDNRWNFVKNLDGTVYREEAFPNGVAFNNANSPLYSDAGLRSRLDAAGLFYPKNPDGTPRVLAGTNVSLESRMLQLQPNRRVDQKVKNKPSYSLNFAYEITEKLVAKAALSRTFGMPSLESGNTGLLSGNNAFQYAEFNEPDPSDGTIGRITVANPGLLPDTSTNYDLELSYYTESGGKLSIAGFWKKVEDQQVSYTLYSTNPAFNDIVEALGLSPAEFEDFQLVTSSNADGSQETYGVELEIRQDLRFLGGWGRNFQTFVSYAQNSLADPVAPRPISLTAPNGTVIETSPSPGRTITKRASRFGGAGLMFTFGRFSSTIRGTYREENETNTGRTTIQYNQTGQGNTPVNYIRTFEPEETRVDISVNYQLTPKLSIFATGRDVFNNSRRLIRRDDLGWMPAYSGYGDYREFGVEVTLGMRGTF